MLSERKCNYGTILEQKTELTWPRDLQVLALSSVSLSECM